MPLKAVKTWAKRKKKDPDKIAHQWETVYQKNKKKYGQEKAAKIAWGAVKRVSESDESFESELANYYFELLTEQDENDGQIIGGMGQEEKVQKKEKEAEGAYGFCPSCGKDDSIVPLPGNRFQCEKCHVLLVYSGNEQTGMIAANDPEKNIIDHKEENKNMSLTKLFEKEKESPGNLPTYTDWHKVYDVNKPKAFAMDMDEIIGAHKLDPFTKSKLEGDILGIMQTHFKKGTSQEYSTAKKAVAGLPSVRQFINPSHFSTAGPELDQVNEPVKVEATNDGETKVVPVAGKRGRPSGRTFRTTLSFKGGTFEMPGPSRHNSNRSIALDTLSDMGLARPGETKGTHAFDHPKIEKIELADFKNKLKDRGYLFKEDFHNLTDCEALLEFLDIIDLYNDTETLDETFGGEEKMSGRAEKSLKRKYKSHGSCSTCGGVAAGGSMSDAKQWAKTGECTNCAKKRLGVKEGLKSLKKEIGEKPIEKEEDKENTIKEDRYSEKHGTCPDCGSPMESWSWKGKRVLGCTAPDCNTTFDSKGKRIIDDEELTEANYIKEINDKVIGHLGQMFANRAAGKCPFCSKDREAIETELVGKDEKTQKEYKISGLCPTCQDGFFDEKSKVNESQKLNERGEDDEPDETPGFFVCKDCDAAWGADRMRLTRPSFEFCPKCGSDNVRTDY